MPLVKWNKQQSWHLTITLRIWHYIWTLRWQNRHCRFRWCLVKGPILIKAKLIKILGGNGLHAWTLSGPSYLHKPCPSEVTAHAWTPHFKLAYLSLKICMTGDLSMRSSIQALISATEDGPQECSCTFKAPNKFFYKSGGYKKQSRSLFITLALLITSIQYFGMDQAVFYILWWHWKSTETGQRQMPRAFFYPGDKMLVK